MMIQISDAIFQTQIFIVVFLLLLLITFKKRGAFNFDSNLTEELKGFSMLMIVFSHIGYFLVSDNRFLYPLSVGAGVGVNLFLLLSGYGLTVSALKKPLPIKTFYLKRLLKLLIPLWIVLISLVAIDFLFFDKTYSIGYLIRSFLGVFLTSDLFKDINSPLWYLSLILFYYLIFPVTFIKSKPYITAIIILIIGWLFLKLPLPLNEDSLDLYKLHIFAFPAGVLLAACSDKLTKQISNNFLRYLLLIILTLEFAYFAINSGVGGEEVKEQAISLLTAFIVLGIFLLKDFQFRILNLVGKYSYEIYLVHWPILIRMGALYLILPASIATFIYLGEFLIVAYLLQSFSQKLLPKHSK